MFKNVHILLSLILLVLCPGNLFAGMCLPSGPLIENHVVYDYTKPYRFVDAVGGPNSLRTCTEAYDLGFGCAGVEIINYQQGTEPYDYAFTFDTKGCIWDPDAIPEPPHCENQILDGDEAGLDCGGSCQQPCDVCEGCFPDDRCGLEN